MRALGGADLDGDKSWIFFGGSGGLKPEWKEIYRNEEAEFIRKGYEQHNKEAIDPLSEGGSSYRGNFVLDQATIGGVSSENTAFMKLPLSYYDPVWRLHMSEAAMEGRKGLGGAVKNRQNLLGAYNAMMGAGEVKRKHMKLSVWKGKWRKDSKDTDKMSAYQIKILFHISKFLKTNGVIVYATCSMENQENWNVIDSFLKLNSNYKLESIDSLVPREWINKKNCLETFPPRDHVDGMFAARIRKC